MGTCMRHNKTIKSWNDDSRVFLVVLTQLILNLRRVIEPSDFMRQNTVDRMERIDSTNMSTNFLRSFIGMDEGTFISTRREAFSSAAGGMKYLLPILQLIVVAKKVIFATVSRRSSFKL